MTDETECNKETDLELFFLLIITFSSLKAKGCDITFLLYSPHLAYTIEEE
jgi:hypothetical protein